MSNQSQRSKQSFLKTVPQPQEFHVASAGEKSTLNVSDQSKIKENVELAGLSHLLVYSVIDSASTLKAQSPLDCHPKKWLIATTKTMAALEDT